MLPIHTTCLLLALGLLTACGGAADQQRPMPAQAIGDRKQVQAAASSSAALGFLPVDKDSYPGTPSALACSY
jgi:hypothetical protein